ncbi:sensor histidine kinase [Inquilinus sp. NPDC058860]|uniref:sensor histidine kinase n=1 Tax=Inquilinus sp. NPDC058860 TaxID=3346652 RepID=UPI0036B5CFB4
MTAIPAEGTGGRAAFAPRARPGHGRLLPLLTAALALAIFLFDTFSPMKIAVAVLYAIVILMSVGFLDRRGILLVALACGGLTVVGFLVGLRQTGFEAHLLRGIVSLSSIAIATALARRSQAATAVLRDSERRWRGIFQSVGVAIWEEDFTRIHGLFEDLSRQSVPDLRRRLEDDHRLVERCIALMRTVGANDAAVRLVGAADAAEAIAMRQHIFLPETVRTWRDLLIALAEGRPSFTGETVLRTIGGERRSVLVTATFPVDGVRSTGLLSVVDITERSRAERALAEARAELAHVSRIATLGELTTSIAHEVKQPLAAIMTDAQACLRWLDRPVPALDEARACAGRITGQASRADHVVQRLRDLTRKAAPERVAADLDTVVDEVVELMRREIADHGVALHLRPGPGVPPVLADRIQLQQVLINLVVNAVQAMETAPRRELAIETGVGPAGEGLILVADSGIGLEPEEMARLFTPFRTTKPGGMGLGLSICRSIVEAHGGRIWASRNADAGLTFHVALPAAGRAA